MSTESTNTVVPEPEQTAAALLDNLLEVLLHRQYPFDRWLDAITTPIEDPFYATGKIGDIISLGFAVGLEEVLTERIVMDIVRKDALKKSAESIRELVGGTYRHLGKQKTNDERRRKGLPPLP